MKLSAVILSLLLVTILLGLAAVETQAESTLDNLPMPEFTVKLASHPYDVPTTYTIDEYTGQKITNPGFHVENQSIEVWIRNNLLLPSYCDGEKAQYYYDVRVKGHFGENWNKLYLYAPEGYDSGNLPPQSSSDYTILALPADYPYNAQLDFQVQTLLWQYTQIWIVEHPMMSGPDAAKLGHCEPRLTLGGTSDWSKTQTLALISETPSDTSSEPEPVAASTGVVQPMEQPFPTFQVVAASASIAIIVAAVLVFIKKRNHSSPA